MGIKLLFADDSVTMQKVMQLTLENENFDLRVAGDGDAAFSLAQKERPDIVVADISMPGLDGFELCEKLKDSPQTAGIPVILISGELEQYDEAKGKAAGAVAHVTKPFKAAEFIATVKRFAVGQSGGGSGIAASVEDILETEEPEVPSGLRAPTAAKKPEVMELVARAKAPEPSEEEEEIEIVSEDIDDLEEDLDDEEIGLEEDLLSTGDLMAMGEEEEAPEKPPEPPVGGPPAGAETVIQPEGSQTPDVFGKESGGEIVREIGEEGVSSGFDIFEKEQAPDNASPSREGHEEPEKILSDVFSKVDMEYEGGEGHDRKSATAPQLAEDEFWNQTLEELNQELGKTVGAPSPGNVPMPSDSLSAHPSPKAADASPRPNETDAIFRQSIERAVGEFIRTQAPGIFKEEMSRAIDRHVKEIFESQLEKAFREEISRMIGASFQKAMPRMLGIIEKITVQITPKIAQHMIKIAIERIQKGETA